MESLYCYLAALFLSAVSAMLLSIRRETVFGREIPWIVRQRRAGMLLAALGALLSAAGGCGGGRPGAGRQDLPGGDLPAVFPGAGGGAPESVPESQDPALLPKGCRRGAGHDGSVGKAENPPGICPGVGKLFVPHLGGRHRGDYRFRRAGESKISGRRSVTVSGFSWEERPPGRRFPAGEESWRREAMCR